MCKIKTTIDLGVGMNQESLDQAEESLVAHLKDAFVAPDNLQRFLKEEEEFLLNEKASLLIESAIKTGRFASLMEVIPREKSSCSIYKFDPPIEIFRQCSKTEFIFKFDEISFKTHGNALTSQSRSKNYELYKKEFIGDHCSSHSSARFSDSNYLSFGADTIDLESVGKEAGEAFYEKSLFDYCKTIFSFKTPQEICREFKNDTTPYGPTKIIFSTIDNKNFSNNSTENPPLGYEKWKSQYLDLPEEVLVQKILSRFVCNRNRSFDLNKFFEKVYSGFFKQVYSFKNTHGEVVQKVIKLIDFENQCKHLIPCTAWRRSYQPENEYFCVPSPEKQVLYNLDFLNTPDIEAVILSDSIEIADLNQNKRCSKIVWTSFLPGSVSDYDKVDWSPLKDKNFPVYYLVCNHSNTGLEEAYLKAKELQTYLMDKEKVAIKFMQIEIDHNTRANKFFRNLSDILEHPPIVLHASIEILSTDEFETNSKFAANVLAMNKRPFYMRKNTSETTQMQTDALEEENAQNDELEPINFLLRPSIYAGEINAIFSMPDIGKTRYAISLCASIISGEKLFSYKWWKTPTSKKKIRKVLYLDFEYNKVRAENNRITYALPYFTTDKIKRDLCNKNFNYLDALSELESDLTVESNHQQILDLLQKYKDVGSPGQSLDLIVFDSLRLISKNEASGSWPKLMILFNKIKFLGTSILLVHHSTKDGFTFAGDADIERDCIGMISLKRDKCLDLSDNTLIEITKSKDALAFEKENFYTYFSDGKGWQTRNKIKVDNVEKLIGLISKAVEKGKVEDKVLLEVERLKFEKSDEIRNILSLAVASNMNKAQITDEISKHAVTGDDKDSEKEEFAKIVGAYRNMSKPYAVDTIQSMLGLAPATYHSKMNETVKYFSKKGMNSQEIVSKLGSSSKKIKNILSKSEAKDQATLE